ncbi:MAG: glycosyltransferase family 4 protein [Methylococcaceae bacterium]|nr:glycosyltransferase family 4 protein [Methylococcaceae bacterium]
MTAFHLPPPSANHAEAAGSPWGAAAAPAEPKLRIGYVLKRFPHLSQTFILNEILELERQGLTVEIISLRLPRDDEPRHHRLAQLRAGVTYISGEEAAEDVAGWARRLGLQHLHAHFATGAADTAMKAAALTGLPYSFTAHARDIYHQGVDSQALAERMGRARFVVTVSDYNQSYLENLASSRGTGGRILRLYNGLDLNCFAPVQGQREPGLIVAIGRLVPKKGFADLVEACAVLDRSGREFRCLIVGDGPERTALERAIRHHRLERRVKLAGAMAQAEVLAALGRAELFALPCIVGDDGDRDGLPTVILEAMALGIPVVSTRLAGIPEMVLNRRTGLLVQQGAVDQLANAMAELLASPDLRHTLSRNGLAHMREHFDLQHNARRLGQWFQAGGHPTISLGA